MKKFKIYTLAFLTSVGLVSCTSYTDPLSGNAVTGGLVTVNSPLVSYVVGNGDDYEYNASFSVFQGEVSTTQVQIYATFYDQTNELVSNQVLVKTIEVPASPQHQDFPFVLTYPELIEGLEINGQPLPTSDSDLNIGDYWLLNYVSTTSQGNVVVNAGTTKVGVSTRFAGEYTVIQGEYWRINVPRPDVAWVGQTRLIESVNATTYRFLEWAGPFFAVTNTHYFTIDSDDYVLTPVEYDGATQLLNGFSVINCLETPNDIQNACSYDGPQNTVVRNDETGEDLIYRTYGYYTTGSGPREIYEVIQKVVK